jgi:hypothetical protein
MRGSQISSIIKRPLLIVLTALLACQGCKLDVVPQDRYTDALIWQNQDNIDLYIQDQYGVFKTFAFGKFPIGYDNATDALTDLMKYTSDVPGNGTVNKLVFEPGGVSPSSLYLDFWSTGYAQIRKVNEFLSGLGKYAKVDEPTRQVYEAEARFIRGYVYFWLVKLHGSVVLLDHLAFNKDNARSSEDDCWNFVAADFAFAAAHLPEERTGKAVGRVTRGAAYGMLAKTWLYAASIATYDKKLYNQDPLTGVAVAKRTAYYKNAMDAAAAVIKMADEGKYTLEGDYGKLFSQRNSKESLLTIQFMKPAVVHEFDRTFCPPADVSGATVAGVPTAELADEFELADGRTFSWNDPAMAAAPYSNREPRFYATILYNGSAWKNRIMNTTPANSLEGFVEYKSVAEPHKTVTGYYLRKMLDEKNTNILDSKSDQSWMVMRYAEVLLIHAEAAGMSGDFDAATKSLKAVRNRVHLPAVEITSEQQLLRAIDHERKTELAFEGERYWDLRRWRKAHTVLNNTRFHGHKITAAGNGFSYEVVDCDKQQRYFPEAFYYLPVPQAEIVNNPAMKQIQGW